MKNFLSEGYTLKGVPDTALPSIARPKVVFSAQGKPQTAGYSERSRKGSFRGGETLHKKGTSSLQSSRPGTTALGSGRTMTGGGGTLSNNMIFQPESVQRHWLEKHGKKKFIDFDDAELSKLRKYF